ncbi:MAG: hypothetical protein PHD64_05875 [Mesotoga sp.]|nr:hypothetical protein [Mesotoga sp.]
MVDASFTSSYITTDAILEAYIGADPRVAAIALKAAAAATQEWYCQRATAIIDDMPFAGERYEDVQYENGVQVDANSDGLTQTLEFPRVIDGKTCDWDEATELPIVPEAIRRACVEEAIALYDYYAGTSSSSSQKREALQRAGVKSYSIGDLSESFGGSSSTTANCGLRSQTAYDLLKRYVVRGCPVL